jgi:DNA-directed RNA polymerase specialized sigma subunit
MNIEQAYKKYTPLIKSRAYSWSRPGVTGLEYDELISIGNEVFITAWPRWEEKKSTFGTFLKSALNKRLYHECITLPSRLKNNCPVKDIDMESLSVNYNPESYTIFRDKMEKCLSPRAKSIVNSALRISPAMIDHMIEETGYARVCKRRISRYLTEVESWQIGQVQKGFAEIKQVMSDL